MPSTSHSRSPVSWTFWLAAVVVLVGALVAATQISMGGDKKNSSVELSAAQSRKRPPRVCQTPTATPKANAWSKRGTYVDKRGATQHLGDGQVSAAETRRLRRCSTAAPTVPAADPGATNTPADPGATTDPAASNDPNAPADPGATTDPAAPGDGEGEAPPAPPAGGVADPNGLGVLATDCSASKLAPHTGFQDGNRCVSTSFGELAGEANNPSLAINDAPQQVNVGQAFTISVSTRNLVRDRFLAAGKGGYYQETSLLNEQGLVRGHFHTACRMLNGKDAQDPAPVPAFFVATEDGGGGAAPDTVKISVIGMPSAGTAQCAVWAGDGSHRVPMMQRANQIPAFDVVRIQVQ
jgi:hypothetical protein